MKKALHFEIQKFRFSKEIIVSFCLILFLFLVYSFSFWQDFQGKYWRWVGLSNIENPWLFFIHYTGAKLEFIVGISILGFILWQNFIEQSNSMWQRLLIVPIDRSKIIYSKLLVIYFFSMITLLFFFNLILLVLKPLVVHRYEAIFTQKKYQEDSFIYFKWIGYYFVVFTKFIAFHFWLTLKCREKYLLSFSIGFTGLLLRLISESPYGICFESSFTSPELVKNMIGSIIYTCFFIYFSMKEIIKFFL
jgi:hypothetical protein